MEREPKSRSEDYYVESQEPDKLAPYQAKIVDVLKRNQLQYQLGGQVSQIGSTATTDLVSRVRAGGIKSVENEISRALSVLERDPNAAVHFGANVLEATMKVYLERRHVPFNEEAEGLSGLWKLVTSDLKINPKDLSDKDLKLIASGLSKVIEGTAYLRNKKSAAHGRTEKQTIANQIKPRHARLVVHSAHTLSNYILECLHDS